MLGTTSSKGFVYRRTMSRYFVRYFEAQIKTRSRLRKCNPINSPKRAYFMSLSVGQSIVVDCIEENSRVIHISLSQTLRSPHPSFYPFLTYFNSSCFSFRKREKLRWISIRYASTWLPYSFSSIFVLRIMRRPNSHSSLSALFQFLVVMKTTLLDAPLETFLDR